MEEKSVKDEVRELNQKIQVLLDSGKVKGIKPKKLGTSQKKRGFVNYIYIRENGTIETMKFPIQEGTTMIEETPRIATPDYVLNWKGNPTIIQPAWSVKPFSPAENLEGSVKENMLAVGWRLLANRAEQGVIKPKKRISGMAIFLIIIAVLVIGYLILS